MMNRPVVPLVLYLGVLVVIVSRQFLIRAIKKRVPEIWSLAGTTFPYLEFMYLRRRKALGARHLDVWLSLELIAWALVFAGFIRFMIEAQIRD